MDQFDPDILGPLFEKTLEDNPEVLRARITELERSVHLLGRIVEDAHKREEFMMGMITKLGDALFKKLPEQP